MGNRIVYNEYITSLGGKSNLVLSVVNIDLDDFKSINDVFGHHEGDKVLRLFARQLEDIFEGKGVSIRMGGDEFVILINENQREIVEKYINTLHSKIEACNESSDMPYRINFSYGMTIFNNTYKSIYELLEHSDKLMYEEKKKKNSRKIKSPVQ